MLSAKRKSLLKIITTLTITLPQLAFAIPVDWQGVFGVDVNSLSNYTRIDGQGTDMSVAPAPEEPGNKSSASFESYLIKLLPTFTINDTASFKMELSSGYSRGGFFGDGQRYNYKNDQFGDVLYYYNTFGSQYLTLNRFWMELYSDTATYGIGRMSVNWGMGAIYNAGENTWDRFASIRDTIVAKIKLGNFGIEPFFGKIGNGDSFTTDTYSIEFGVPLTYDVPESDMKMGFIWSRKNLAPNNSVVETPESATDTTFLTSSNLNIFDFYFKKSFGKLGMEFEVPLYDGKLGNFRGEDGSTDYKTFAVLLNFEYKFSYSFKMGLDFARVPGDNPDDETFTSMYLHPNYQLADILFRYNLSAISNNTNTNVWDSYMVNASVIKLYFEYLTEKWILNLAGIYAQADKVASTGGEYVVYERNTFPIKAAADQSKNMGFETDFNFDYAWNNEVKIGGELAYLITGAYWGFNNTDTPFETKNSFLLKLKASVTF